VLLEKAGEIIPQILAVTESASDAHYDPPLSCPSCSGDIERDPLDAPPPPRCHVTLKCMNCGRFARYIAGAA
jgi:NAD-dependent DNA ligase